ncbi:ankyrin repeat-containing domain protein [Microdochium trichocladiopsis]|uniref:Ankyrin repeat-containing domain protein n=1 Tax=Microdochium trichocladiopsis TaxID=1682393 RepID=A0A9P9BLR9_9PEZI|nr:ankyrin repeat-containing domain protein [Microdochium trichocladiopsis]KAH7014372.1 ankyrin repeat-containing domain protein [Microdochium trichocladiopsis]
MAHRGTLEDAPWDDDAVVLAFEDVADFNEDNILPLPADELADVRAWLQPTNYEGDGSELAKHAAAHLGGTGEWLLKSAAYREWHDRDGSDVLWIRGIPGSGKSVHAASLVHQLRQEQVPVLFFFFRHIIAANHQPVSAVRDWLAQILPYSPPLQARLKSYVAACHTLDSTSSVDLWQDLQMALRQIPRAFIVADALDEMDRGVNNGEMHAFMDKIVELTRRRPGRTKMVITSRPVAYIESALRRAGGSVVNIRLKEELVDHDIATFVAHHLASSSISNDNQALIKAAVPGRANGLFLYAKLAMDAFMRPGADVQAILGGLPRDLDTMYADILKQHALRSGVAEETQVLILQLVTHATRPLRVLEIASLINVTQCPSKMRDLKAAKGLVRLACGPLIEILPDESVSVVHHSLTEYLTGVDDDAGSVHHNHPILEAGATHQRLALACLEYLQSESLMSDISKPWKKHDTFAQYAGKNWFVHARKATLAGRTEQARLNQVLDNLFQSKEHIWEILWMADVGVAVGSGMDVTPAYAATALRLHEYLDIVLSRDPKQARVDLGASPRTSSICLASQKGYVEIVESLLRAGGDPREVNMGSYTRETPLHFSVQNNHLEITKLLLDAGADLMALRNFQDPSTGLNQRVSPLQWAITHGYTAVLDAMLPHMKSVETVGQALLWTASASRADMLAAVLGHPLAARLSSSGDDGPGHLSKALAQAAARHNAPMVRTLLDAGAEATALLHAHAADGEGQTAGGLGMLHVWAAGDPDVDIMPDAAHISNLPTVASKTSRDPEAAARVFRMLVAAGADVHQRTSDELHSTPLHYARDATTARLLVGEGGADVGAVNSGGETLLRLTRDPATVKYILEVMSTEKPEEAALAGTTTTTTPEIVAAMLERLNSDWYRWNRTLFLEQVEVFLDHGVDPTTVVDEDGQTPLHLLVQLVRTNADSEIRGCGGRRGPRGDGAGEVKDTRVPLLQRLLRHPGMDANMRNAQGQAALHLLNMTPIEAYKGNIDLLAALVDAGADLEARDGQGRTPLFFMLESDEAHVRPDMMVTACKEIRGPLVQWLLDAGADPRAVDREGNTLFHEAHDKGPWPWRVYKEGAGEFALFDQLASLGVDPTQPNHAGKTPLHLASTITPGAFHHDKRPGQRESTTTFDWFLGRHGPGNVDVADPDGVTPLHNAATFSEYMARRLLEYGADPLRMTKEGLNGLHLAARARQVNILGMMLESVAESDRRAGGRNTSTHRHSRSPLFYAVASGKPESVRLLLEAGMPLVTLRPQTEEYQDSVLQAVVEFEEELANWPRRPVGVKLGSRDVGSVSLGDRFRMPMAPMAPPSERLDEILDLLSEYGLIPKHHIRMAIVEAAEKKAAYTLTCLLRISEQLGMESSTEVDNGSLSALVEARQEVAKPFEEAIAARGTLSTDEFHEAMKERLFDVVAKGLSTPDSALQVLETSRGRHDFGTTILQYLAAGGHAALLAKVASAESIAKQSHEGVEPLLVTACRREIPNMDVVRLLVEHFGVDVNDVGKVMPSYWNTAGTGPSGTSALHALAEGGHWWQAAQAIPYLVAHGADVNIRSQKGQAGKLTTPLNVALRPLMWHCNLSVSKRAVQVLLEHGADVTAVDDQGVSPLDRGMRDVEIWALLVGKGARVSSQDLIAAIDNANPAALEALLAAGADPNGRRSSPPPIEKFARASDMFGQLDLTKEQRFPLHHALVTNSNKPDVQARMVSSLLKKGADPFARYDNSSLLHQIFARKSSWEPDSCLRQMLETGALRGLDPNSTDAHGVTLFHLSCRHGPDKHKPGQNALHHGPGEPPTPAAIMLSLGTVDVYARDKDRRNSLHHLIAAGEPRADTEMIRTVSRLAPELINQWAYGGGRTPFHEAVAHLSWAAGTEVVDILLDAGADPTKADREGNTPLHILLGGEFRVSLDNNGSDDTKTTNRTSSSAVVVLDRLLSQPGADINAANGAGVTPLFAYLRSGTARPADYQRGITWKQGEDLAEIEKWEVAVLAIFDALGADWSVRCSSGSGSGKTLLHAAVEWQAGYAGGRAARVKYLLGKNVDPGAEDQTLRTVLDYAAALGARDVLELFGRTVEVPRFGTGNSRVAEDEDEDDDW